MTIIPMAVEISVTTANQWVGLIASLLALTATVIAALRRIFQMQMQIVQSEEAINALRSVIEELEKRSDEDMGHVASAITDLSTQMTTTLALYHPEHAHSIKVPRFRRMRIMND